MHQLRDAQNWSGLVAVAATACIAAAQVRATRPDLSADIYSLLGGAYGSLQQHAKALEMYKCTAIIMQEIGASTGNVISRVQALKDLAVALANTAGQYMALGDLGEAVPLLENARKIQQAMSTGPGQLRGGDRESREHLGLMCQRLGECYTLLEKHAQAIEPLEQSKVMAEEMGNREIQEKACASLGDSYYSLGQFDMAIQMLEQAQTTVPRRKQGALLITLGCCNDSLMQHEKAASLFEQAIAVAEEVGDRLNQGVARMKLGEIYRVTNQPAKAIEMQEQAKVILEEVGDGVGVASSINLLGNCYFSLGQYEKAVRLYEEARTIEQEEGVYLGVQCNNLGNCHFQLDHFQQAFGLYEEARMFAQEAGNREYECTLWGSLGRCQTALFNYEQAVACYKAQWSMAEELDLVDQQAVAALNLGVIIWAQARVEHFDNSAAPLPSAHARPAAYMDSTRNASQWFETALKLSMSPVSGDVHVKEMEDALLHLSFLAFDVGQEDDALDFLRQLLYAQMGSLQRVGVGSQSSCRGCFQKGGKDVVMLVCSGCGIARFCNADHQKMASKKGELRSPARHKDMCLLLKKWQQVVEGNEAAEACTPDLLAFLRLDPWRKHRAPVPAGRTSV